MSFAFDAQRTRAAVEELAGALDPSQRVPVYAFPFLISSFDLRPDHDACARGFRTILRLPFRKDVSRGTIAEHLRATISARLLLFLADTTSLEVSGTPNDFRAEIERHSKGDCTEILIRSAGEPERWLVFNRALQDLDRALVDPIGEAWKRVEQVHVALAVRLDDSGLPCIGRPEPLHVYFPTEEATGFSLVLQGDFALELDRRHVGRSREMLPYNEWLSGRLAELIAEAAESLTSCFPSQAGVVAAFAVTGHSTGFGEHVAKCCLERLKRAQFVPTVGAGARKPTDVSLVCDSLGQTANAHQFLDLSQKPDIVMATVEANPQGRKLLAEHLGAPQLSIDATLQLIREPRPDEDQAFYEWLIEWSGLAHHDFAAQLPSVRCVRTLGGGWVAPDSGVFFPRQRDAVPFPDGLKVPIAALPRVEGLRPLLESAGVHPFEWRQLIPDFVLPLLRDPNASPEIRKTALEALRAYFLAERTGDARIRAQIAEVLLPAHNADAASREMRSAGTLYFSNRWVGHDRLEQLYGPFNEVEFLDIDPPADSERRAQDFEFLSWVGVASAPRIDERHADARESWSLDNLARHPHHVYGKVWRKWQADEISRSRRCDSGHDSSQHLRSSFALDRLEELAATRDVSRLSLLWTELSANWTRYQQALYSEIQCLHGWHTGPNARRVPSLFYYMLKSLEWVPAVRAKARALVRPGQAWRVAPNTPARIVERVSALEPALDTAAGALLIAALEIVDAARPSPLSLIGLLRELAGAFENRKSADEERSYLLAARWAMRTLNDALDGKPLPGPVLLLAEQADGYVFTEKPFVASDALLAETWKPIFPILDGERDLRHLHRALGLRILDNEVKVQPDPRDPRPDLRDSVLRHFDEAKPYLAAYAFDQVPSRHDTVLRLARLELVVCDRLFLRYSLDGEVRERDDAVSYIASRIEQEGSTRRLVGTAHLEINPRTQMPHWYTFGPQLAHFLDVPNLEDAFSLLLAGSKADRELYLTARRIPGEAVELARIELTQRPSEDVVDEFLRLPDAPSPAPPGTAASPATAAGAQQPAKTLEPEPVVDLPALDHTGIAITEAPPAAPHQAPLPPKQPRMPGIGGGGDVDRDRQHKLQQLIGKRGEEAVFEAEKRRLVARGLDPKHVVWRSKTHETAPHDIESLDDDGQQIYIEVKATTSDDPFEPFPISEGELLQAMQKRSNYYIYRVTSAHTDRPTITRFKDPIRRLNEHSAHLRLAGAHLAFHSE